MGLLAKLFGFGSSKGKKSPKKPVMTKTNLEKRFTLQHRLGQGSMSKVWKAIDNQAGRVVCLKILDVPKLEALKKRFVGLDRPDEGEVALSLDHPNIVKTFEWGISTKKEEFLVMEIVNGVGLNFLIDTKAPSFVGREYGVLIQTGEAIAHFHDRGFIHRDICPRNIMVTNEFEVKLIDFGLAVPNTPEFRRPGNRTGTASYMAPELILRSPTDQRIDVFSFGVTVYETLTGGGHPWDIAAQSLQSILQHINHAPKDPREFKPDLSEETAQVIMKGIAKDPRNRYQTMRQFISALEHLSQNVATEDGVTG